MTKKQIVAPDQKAFLTERGPEFLAARKGGDKQPFFDKTVAAFLAQWPVTLPLNWSPAYLMNQEIDEAWSVLDITVVNDIMEIFMWVSCAAP